MSWRNRENTVNIQKATAAVDRFGLVLTYPMKGAELPMSLWKAFFPRSEMRWAWDENADIRVVQIWDLRERLSRKNSVVYLKWYKDRATFLSCELYEAILSQLYRHLHPTLEKTAEEIYQLLAENSPQSSKALKQRAKNELGVDVKTYDKALKNLWRLGFLVGRGEVDDGAFPSLNIAAAELVFPKQWENAIRMKEEQAKKTIETYLPALHPARKQLERMLKGRQKKKQLPKIIGYNDLVSKKK